jgi:SAM-dependent methyltransferase
MTEGPVRQPYTNDYYDALRDGARRSAAVVVPLVLGLVPARSVIDLGCGRGTWLAAFREHGAEEARGVDGDHVDRARLEVPADCFEAHDLTRPFRAGRRFDLAVSLEVAEHLPAEAADGLVESLCLLAPVVLFSAAAPYQGGEGHVNEQWPAYWAERFAARGHVPVDCLRRRIWDNSKVDWWYAQNAFLYVERGRLGADAALRRESEAAGPQALPLVHPRRYLEWVEWGLGLCGGTPSEAARVGVMS